MSETTAPVEKEPAATTRRKSTATTKTAAANAIAKAAEAAASTEPKESESALSLRESSQMAIKRPVEPSKLTVASTFRSVGSDRPIFASQLQTVGDFYSSGIRPIGASHLEISQTYTVMGNRPVASNEIDDPRSLMGYLD